MTHVEIFNRRKKPSHQLDHFALEAISVQPSSCCRIDQTLWRFQSSSLPLCAGSAGHKFPVARARAENCLYGQAALEFGSTPQRIRQRRWPFLERFDQSSPRTFSPPRRQTWLNVKAKKSSNWNIATIAWRNESWASFMNYCFHRLPALSAMATTNSSH